ncbi:hypothetical protein L484_005312 [Morus notabilis]|uniref:Uncharacterized protein n=1 Tax=Morus notabilis TaxID=981085 RepID=W9RXP5_9ROSA|nr:hypothetical protein L484_005312 [Morus notabilis]
MRLSRWFATAPYPLISTSYRIMQQKFLSSTEAKMELSRLPSKFQSLFSSMEQHQSNQNDEDKPARTKTTTQYTYSQCDGEGVYRPNIDSGGNTQYEARHRYDFSFDFDLHDDDLAQVYRPSY